MNGPSGDQLDAAARYLATGDPAGLPDDGTRHRLDRTLALLSDRCTWDRPSPGLLGAIFDQVERLEWDEQLDRRRCVERREPSGPSGPSRPIGQIDGIGTGRQPGRHHRTRRPRKTWRTSWRLVGVAAVVVLAIVGAAVTGVVRSPAPGTDGRDLTLAGTDLAPGASAEATLRPTPTGVAVTLRVEGLGPAPPDAYYQAWVKGPRGTVAIGTFHVRGDDDEPIELWSGVDPAAYPELTVTLEPEDGNPASSGRKVLGSEGG